jgi:hypothetical protein
MNDGRWKVNGDGFNRYVIESKTRTPLKDDGQLTRKS